MQRRGATLSEVKAFTSEKTLMGAGALFLHGYLVGDGGI
jgi:hypothetical protein